MIILSMILGLCIAIAIAFIKNNFFNQDIQDSEKMGLIKGEFKNHVARNFHYIATSIHVRGIAHVATKTQPCRMWETFALDVRPELGPNLLFTVKVSLNDVPQKP